MPDTRRTVLIASGISLLVVVLVPVLVCAAMMSGASSMDMDMSNGNMAAMRGMAWRAGGVVLLTIISGVVLLTLGVRQR